MKFCSRDEWSPFGRGGPNAYAYCKGDPVNASDPTGHNVWYLGGSLLAGVFTAYASIKAATAKGRAQADWIIVAVFSGVMALGLGYSAYRAKGNSKHTPAPVDAPDTPVGGGQAKSGSLKQSISSNTSAKQKAKELQSMKEASELYQSRERHEALLENAYKQSPKSSGLESYTQGLTDKYGRPLPGRPRVDEIRDPVGHRKS
ncbi:RHS repeat-associated core domain-containing protein [Pseudomonas bharatica]|uniref:RHS repeat-associated core domain-containing protein n=1 Tax=Pseudomonas bharatica TaxID=2692112 RepID=UPI003B2836DE